MKIWFVNMGNEVKMVKLEIWMKFVGFYDVLLLYFIDKLFFFVIELMYKMNFIYWIEIYIIKVNERYC